MPSLVTYRYTYRGIVNPWLYVLLELHLALSKEVFLLYGWNFRSYQEFLFEASEEYKCSSPTSLGFCGGLPSLLGVFLLPRMRL